MWGFQGHGVIPDIVTMAKGIANGFPMGAIVTTPGEFYRQKWRKNIPPHSLPQWHASPSRIRLKTTEG